MKALVLTALLFFSGIVLGQERSIVNATGTLVERVRIWDSDGVPIDYARVRADDGRALIADLGPPGGEGTLQEGDRVVLSGRGIDIGGETLVVGTLASELTAIKPR